MPHTDPYEPTDPTFECTACGRRVDDPADRECSGCGGELRNISVPRQE
jgi:hypothetical protein